MLKLSEPYADGNKYKLALFCTIDSERFSYEIEYDNTTGDLVKANTIEVEDDPEDKTDLMTYFQRNSNRVHLLGMTNPITKQSFLEKMEKLPLFTNLIRVETFYRDMKENDLKLKRRIEIPVYCVLSISKVLFLFKFAPRKKVISEGMVLRPQLSKKSVTIEMNHLYEEDVLTDIRSRMIDALLVAENVVRDNQWIKLLQSANFEMVDVMGSRIFSVLSKNEDNFLEWSLKPNDYTRLSEFDKTCRSTGDCILLKLEYPQKGTIGKNLRLKESELPYDCLSLYKHPDKS